jgi:hypothetical protein
LNISYEIVAEVDLSSKDGYMDLHEFNIIENNQVLVIAGHKQSYNLSHLGLSNNVRVDAPGFEEFNIITKEIMFKWNALDFIDPSASYQDLPWNYEPDVSWDWL